MTLGLRAALCVLGVAAASCEHRPARTFRSALPATATDVRERSYADGFLPDHSYCLKATMPAFELPLYAARVGLLPATPARLAEDDGWLQLTCPDRVEWWDPPHTYEGAWLRHDGDLWVVAVHHDGHLYLSSSDH